MRTGRRYRRIAALLFALLAISSIPYAIALADENPGIRLDIPDTWFSEKKEVMIPVLIEQDEGSETVRKIEARPGRNAEWIDVTDTRSVPISANAYVSVRVTYEDGTVNEIEEPVRIFDLTPPVIEAVVEDGILSVNGSDDDSGIAAITVNGYQFAEPADGKLKVRLQRFDAGRESFRIEAVDFAGNRSETYRIDNPYFTDQMTGSEGDSAAEELPVSALPDEPSSAEAVVTEHISTGTEGETEGSINEREFYTIETESGKRFYLIIERGDGEETVRFLTEVSETDLLNVVKSEAATLPKNSAYPTGLAAAGLPGITEEEAASVLSGILEGDPDTGKEESVKPEQTEFQEKGKQKAGNPMLIPFLLIFGTGITVYLLIRIIRFRREKRGRTDDDGEETDPEEIPYPDETELYEEDEHENN